MIKTPEMMLTGKLPILKEQHESSTKWHENNSNKKRDLVGKWRNKKKAVKKSGIDKESIIM